MVELSEYCLDRIFQFLTPVEWIQISEVCRLWNMIVQRRWNKITQICHEGWLYADQSPIIPVEDAEKMIIHTTQYCKYISVEPPRDEQKCQLMLYGPSRLFCYKVNNFNTDRMFELLVKNATEVTDLEFHHSQNRELVQQLLDKNKIKEIEVRISDDFWRGMIANSVETLNINFNDPEENLKPFNGVSMIKKHFPKLQTLKVEVSCTDRDPSCILEVLPLILPYVPGIKSLELQSYIYDPTNLVFKDIIRFPQLEELTLKKNVWTSSEIETCMRLDELLEISCPKLRVVKIHGFKIENDALHSILSLPNLEKLNIESSEVDFLLTKALPEMNTLSTLIIDCSDSSSFHSSCRSESGNDFSDSTVSMTGLCFAISKMLNLKHLEVKSLSTEQSLMVTCEAITAAVRQGKDVNVGGDSSCLNELKIVPENSSSDIASFDEKSEKLCHIVVSQQSKDYFENVIAFVQRNLKGLKAIRIEGK